MKRVLTGVLVTLSLGVAQRSPCADTSDPTIVKSGVVAVVAKGISTVAGNIEVGSQATGFFASKDGYLITAYHLYSDLVTQKKADARTVTYEVHFANGDVLPASRVNAQPEVDLLILMAQISDRDVQILTPAFRSNSHLVLGQTPLYTAGYPAGYSFTVDQGVLKNWGPNAPMVVWATSFNFKDGQSGSPILLGDNRVIAYARADDADASTIGLVVPVSAVPANYWDSQHDAMSTSLATAISNTRGRSVPTVVVTTEAKPTAKTTREDAISLVNSACEPPKAQTFHFDAVPGWRIEPGSIRLAPSQVAGNVSAQVGPSSAAAFDVTVTVRNQGQCVRVFNAITIPDQPARYAAVVSYDEVPTDAAPPRPVTVSEVAAAPNVTTPILTDRKPSELSFSVRNPSGETVDFKPTADELKRVHGSLVLDAGKVLARVGARSGGT